MHTLIKRTWNIFRQKSLKRLLKLSRVFLYHRLWLFPLIIARAKYHSLTRPGVADPYKILWIDPNRIEQRCGRFDRSDIGTIRSGDWDREVTEITSDIKFELIRLHIEEDRQWDDLITSYLFPLVEKNGSFDGMTSKQEIRERYHRIGRLCRSIREDGLKSHKELGESRLSLNHIAVNIARDGDIIFEGSGTHRLAIAKVLELETVPVQVWVRHEHWQQIRDHIAETGSIPETYYGHPDLDDLTINSDP